jgi:hypothetical protein
MAISDRYALICLILNLRNIRLISIIIDGSIPNLGLDLRRGYLRARVIEREIFGPI